MGIIRFAFVVFVVVAMVSLATSLFGTAASAGLAALGAVFLLPILLFKVLFFVLLLGFFGRMACGWGRGNPGRAYRSWTQRPSAEPTPSTEDRFEEWHRMAHAREEVDSWTPEV